LTEDSQIPAEYNGWVEIWTGKRLRDKNYFVLVKKK